VIRVFEIPRLKAETFNANSTRIYILIPGVAFNIEQYLAFFGIVIVFVVRPSPISLLVIGLFELLA
jgi:hypothetical protein